MNGRVGTSAPGNRFRNASAVKSDTRPRDSEMVAAPASIGWAGRSR